ncbi:M56 family metallopeptidase [Actinosynnema sp. CA-248983]
MILAFALVLGAAVVGWAAPRPLRGLTTSRVDPALALAWWFLMCLGVAVTAAAGVVMVLLPEHGPARWVLQWLHGCWTAVQHGGMPRLDDLVGLLGTTVALAVAGRVGIAAIRRRAAARRVHRRQLDLLRIAAREQPGPIPVLWLDHEHPLAYSAAGSPPFIVATRGLSDLLSDTELAAVLEHERAHVRGRHHVLVGFAEALAWALPFVPLMRQAPAAVRVLVEMAADRASATRHGADVVRAALLRVGACGAPAGALAVADHDVALRLARLTRPTRTAPVRRVCSWVTTAVVATSTPGLAGLGLLAATALISCPLPPT